MQSSDELGWLQHWYLSQCDGDWEHQYGIEITNIDNPGWRFVVDLADTDLEDIPFETKRHQLNSEDEWWICEVKNKQFVAHCGPRNLKDVIQVFRSWVVHRAMRPSLPK